jgi:hypothetical protein
MQQAKEKSLNTRRQTIVSNPNHLKGFLMPPPSGEKPKIPEASALQANDDLLNGITQRFSTTKTVKESKN